MDDLRYRVRTRLQAVLDRRERALSRWPGIQGLSDDAGSADISGMQGWVYVRLGNAETVTPAFNNRTSHRNGLPVIVGYLPEQPTLFQVISVRQVYHDESAEGGAIGPHGDQHTYPNEDWVPIRLRQIVDCRVYPTATPSLSVQIADGYYDIAGTIYYYAGGTLDLSTYVPTSGKLWALIEMAADGPEVVTGATISAFTLDNIPAGSGTYWCIAALALSAGQTTITDYPSAQHIFDLRFLNATVATSVTVAQVNSMIASAVASLANVLSDHVQRG